LTKTSDGGLEGEIFEAKGDDAMSDNGRANRAFILGRLKDFQHVQLATVDGGKPRVRPVTLIYNAGKLWVMTDTESAKVDQIRRNPRVEFCLQFTEGDADCSLRISGTASIVAEREARKKIAEQVSFFKDHWKTADDPGYTLVEINPTEANIVSPTGITNYKL
jgi:general stress protein 26